MPEPNQHSVQELVELVRVNVADIAGSGDIRFSNDIRRWQGEANDALDSLEEQLETAQAELTEWRTSVATERLQEKLEAEREAHMDWRKLAGAENARVKRLEEQLQTAQEELRVNDRLVESAWRERDDETEKAKRAEEQLEASREALRLAMGRDLRLNGCACTDAEMCYLHGRIMAPLVGDSIPVSELGTSSVKNADVPSPASGERVATGEPSRTSAQGAKQSPEGSSPASEPEDDHVA